jgi:hypothetical protein
MSALRRSEPSSAVSNHSFEQTEHSPSARVPDAGGAQHGMAEDSDHPSVSESVPSPSAHSSDSTECPQTRVRYHPSRRLPKHPICAVRGRPVSGSTRPRTACIERLDSTRVGRCVPVEGQPPTSTLGMRLDRLADVQGLGVSRLRQFHSATFDSACCRSGSRTWTREPSATPTGQWTLSAVSGTCGSGAQVRTGPVPRWRACRRARPRSRGRARSCPIVM